MEFEAFPKITRLKRACVITEKIDGTNAQIAIEALDGYEDYDPNCVFSADGLALYVGSRTRWITPGDDNFGFAAWVKDHAEELLGLGEGRHFGEWWGRGIQRNYGLQERKFSLFNTSRWGNSSRPSCCDYVPVLYAGDFFTGAVEEALEKLRSLGSIAAPGFMKPEGIVVYHAASKTMFKCTIEKDEEPKGKQVYP
jgi:hypothetical protein